MSAVSRFTIRCGAALCAVALLAACSTQTHGTSAALDDGGKDAGVCVLPQVPTHGSIADWYKPSALPSGACSAECTLILAVNFCCHEPNTPELAQYSCSCSDSKWTCRVLSSGGFCDGGYYAPEAGEADCY